MNLDLRALRTRVDQPETPGEQAGGTHEAVFGRSWTSVEHAPRDPLNPGRERTQPGYGHDYDHVLDDVLDLPPFGHAHALTAVVRRFTPHPVSSCGQPG